MSTFQPKIAPSKKRESVTHKKEKRRPTKTEWTQVEFIRQKLYKYVQRIIGTYVQN